MAERPIPAYVLDATVGAKWHLRDEDFVQPALAVRTDFVEDRIRLVGPSLLYHEVSASLLKASKNKDRPEPLTYPESLQEIRAFQLWGIPILPSDHLAPRAAEFANRC